MAKKNKAPAKDHKPIMEANGLMPYLLEVEQELRFPDRPAQDHRRIHSNRKGGSEGMSRFEYLHDEHGVHLLTHGDLMDVVSEIGAMIQVIHNGLTSQSQDVAALFRAEIRAAVTEDSPVWQEMEHHEGETMIAMVTEQDKE